MSARGHLGEGGTRSTILGAGILLSLCAIVVACEPSSPPAESEYLVSDPWENYAPMPPTPERASILMEHPAIYPQKECIPYDESMEPLDEGLLELAEDGSLVLCIWQHPAGCVPEGHTYPELAGCDKVRTLGPSWYVPPTQKFESDLALLEDPEFVRELEWVRGQALTNGCACCHASDAGDYASFFDIDAPGIWTDTLTMTGVVMAAGLADEHKYLGYLPPETNLGFDRETTIFATNDIPRMQAFFEAEFARRGGTPADIELASKTFMQINSGLFNAPTECGPGEGIDEQGHIIWKGDGARQIYVQELGSRNPGSPPNFDKPEGTVWAIYADHTMEAMASGTMRLGESSDSAVQVIPSERTLEPSFEEGRSYRLFVTPDFMRSVHVNCTFTYGEAAQEEVIKTCESEDTLCATLQIPESLNETPEKLVVALYKSLPPLGPPDVFPPFSMDLPELTPGGTLEVVMDANAEGPYYVYAVLYMPGGGLASWQAAAGIDYTASSEAVVLDGQGVTLDVPIAFNRAE